MNINDKMITLARSYCKNSYTYWVDKYHKERTGNDYLHTYTDTDYDLFPRYVRIAAILKGIDLLVGKKYKSFNSCVHSLLDAVNFKNAFVDSAKNAIQIKAMNDEEQKYRKFILNFNENDLMNTNIERLTYKRMLGVHESVKVRNILLDKWGYDGYWYPISKENVSDDILFLMAKYISPLEKDIVGFIKNIAFNKYYAIDECKEDYKYSIKNFNLSLYQGTETFCCDKSFEWAVYGSHEGTLTFGGEILVSKVKELLKGYESKFNLFEWI